MDTPKILAALKPQTAERFIKALAVLERGVADHHIWNVDFNDSKDSLSRCVNEAMSVAAEPFYVCRRASTEHYPSNDPRYDISGYMTWISAPKLLRNLDKKDGYNNPIILEYMTYLRELVLLGELVKEVKHYIEKGRKPNVTNKTPEEIAAEIANTGVCCICLNHQKLDTDQSMVKHGYKMSEYNHSGYQIGSCFGVKFLPYEFSCEANKQWLAQVLRPQLKGQKSFLKSLKNSTMDTLERTEEIYQGFNQKPKVVTHTFNRGTREYEDIRDSKIGRTEYQIKMLKGDIQHHETLVANWALKPLLDGSILKPENETNQRTVHVINLKKIAP